MILRIFTAIRIFTIQFENENWIKIFRVISQNLFVN